MLKKNSCLDEVKFILDNIRFEDKQELSALFGNNWYDFTLASLTDKDFLILYGYDANKCIVPIAMGGFHECHADNPDIACVWLLSSYLIEYNRHLLIKTLKNQIFFASKKYKIMYNYIFHMNREAKNWLKKLGFKFDNPRPSNIKLEDGFEFFYKVS